MAKFCYQGKIVKIKIDNKCKVSIFIYVDHSLLQEVNGKKYLCLPNIEDTNRGFCFPIENNTLELNLEKIEKNDSIFDNFLQYFSNCFYFSKNIFVEFDENRNVTSIEFFLD